MEYMFNLCFDFQWFWEDILLKLQFLEDLFSFEETLLIWVGRSWIESQISGETFVYGQTFSLGSSKIMKI